LKYLALLVDAVNFTPSSVATLEVETGTSETSPQSITGFPCVVMRDLAVDMVSDVSLRDTVCAGGSDPGHDGSEITEEVTVISRQSATGESELAGAIMRDEGVRVLQESDQHEPVVDPGETLFYDLGPW
jgi:hypothetical protein